MNQRLLLLVGACRYMPVFIQNSRGRHTPDSLDLRCFNNPTPRVLPGKSIALSTSQAASLPHTIWYSTAAQSTDAQTFSDTPQSSASRSIAMPPAQPQSSERRSSEGQSMRRADLLVPYKLVAVGCRGVGKVIRVVVYSDLDIGF